MNSLTSTKPWSKEKTVEIEEDKSLEHYIRFHLDKFDTGTVEKYWSEKLKTAEPVSVDKVPGQKKQEIEKELFINQQELKALKSFCRDINISVPIFFKGIYALTIQKVTNTESSFVIREIIGGRKINDYRNTIGCLVQTLPVVFNKNLWQEKLTVSDFFRYVKAQKKELGDNEYISTFLQNKLIGDEEITFTYNYQNFMKLKSRYKSVNIYRDSGNQIRFGLLENYDGLRLLLNYDISFFHEENFLERIKLLAKQISEGKTKLEELNFITKQEKDKFQVRNNTITDFPSKKTVVDLFEEQAEKSAETIALVFQGKPMTYRQLNQKANRIARYLQNIKVQNPLVAISMDRSFEMIAGLMGILKAGRAYVPVDPDYPRDRISYMLKDSGAPVLLTQSSLKERLPIEDLPPDCKIVFTDEADINSLPAQNPETAPKTDDLAYMIYTSGSTGRPKGVMIEHTALSNFVYSVIRTYPVSPGDRFLQFASLNFDASIQEIIGTLCAGARLILLNTNHLQANTLQNTIREEQVTIAHFPPAYWQQIIDETDPRELTSLETFISGGEALSPELARRTLQILPKNTNVWNAYGPTEATVISSLFKITGRNFKDIKTIPIGKPIENYRIYILNSREQLQPDGTPGELCIAGAGLAKGYFNRPELTAEKFKKIKILGKTERIYKTGDLARWLPDGNIEFLGRIDHQVKIRGFRIELGEIEAVMQQHPGVRDVVIIIRETKHSEKHLTAFYIPGKQTKTKTLREFLKERLPDYMIPSFFIPIDTIPLTPNGKTDRKKLNELAVIHREPENKKLQKPQNDTEKELSKIWEFILNTEINSINDNFFELGGHSLNAIKLVSLIHKQMGIDIKLRDIFETQTIGELATRIQSIQKSEYKPIPPVEKQEHYDISNAQKRLWIINRIENDPTAYNIPYAFYFDGILDRNIFTKALTALIERHESLRTVFTTIHGEPKQKIRNTTDVLTEIPYSDISGANNTESRIKTHIHSVFNTIFDLNKGPLIKAEIIKTGPQRHLFLLNIHHIISDGWSAEVLFTELSSLYNAFLENKENPLPPLTIQYKDYALWHNKLLQSDNFEKTRNYWKNKLKGELPVLNLPTDYPRPKIKTSNGNSFQFELDRSSLEKLDQFNREHGISLFITLQSIIKILLHKYSGQEDIIIGSLTAGRQHPDLEKQIGFYVNTIPLRDKIEKEDSFDEVIKKVKKTTLEAFDHQNYPFNKLVEEFEKDRNLSRSPLFDVLFVLQNKEQNIPDIKGIKVTNCKHNIETAKFDLSFDAFIGDNKLVMSINYNTGLFKAETIERMAGHFRQLTDRLIQNPRQAISRQSVITKQEIQHIQTWNNTAADYPENQTITGLFEQQVEKTPGKIAVVFEDKQLTYRQLNEKANQLAYHLQHIKKNSPGETEKTGNPLVAIYTEKSTEMIIGILGILKAGYAYLPIDPGYPGERIRLMLEDSKARIILTQDSLNSHISLNELSYNCHAVCIDKTDFSTYSPENPDPGKPGDLAYVIYTSGSTGKPKGVMIEHSSLTNFVCSSVNTYAITDNDKILQFASISFDTAAEEIYPCLLQGATLVLRTEEMLQTTETFIEECNKQKLTILDLPTAYWHNLLIDTHTVKNHWPQSVRLVIIGGEAVSGESVKKWMEIFGDYPTLLNTYGPTEATVVTTYFQFPGSEPDNIINAPIGKPVSNACTYILNPDNQIQPVGIAGELCISGAGLARGYLNRPELTSEKFIEIDILGQAERIYKTGDLARWLPDGNIEFLGRIDHQVKVRGFRIELGEIETSLCQHPDVREAIVLLHETENNKQLVTYLTTGKKQSAGESKNQPASLTTENLPFITDLRNWLKSKLPDYMIPSQFIILDHIPLTPNGKTDRRSLPAPEVDLSYVEYEPPQSKAEQKIYEVWKQILKRDKISIHDNFFDLGGHSLLAIQMNNLIHQEYPALRMVDMFSYPTIHTLAGYLDQTPGCTRDKPSGETRGEKRRAVLTNRRKRIISK